MTITTRPYENRDARAYCDVINDAVQSMDGLNDPMKVRDCLADLKRKRVKDLRLLIDRRCLATIL